MTDLIDPGRLRAALVTSRSPWSDVEHHASIDSTNARAAGLARPWHVVVADHQTAGRGRLARSWEAPAGSSALLSATVPRPAARAGWIPLLTGVAVVGAVEETTGLVASLKWPNDVLLPADGSRKVCGILCQVAGDVVVVGVGLNLTQGRDELPVPTATSLALAGATDADPTALVAAFLTRLAALVTGPPGVRAAYRDRCATIGQEVRLTRSGAADVLGRAVAVDEEGRLVIEQGGRRTAWAAGDVVHVRPPDRGPGLAPLNPDHRPRSLT